jgi:hypothetical protein
MDLSTFIRLAATAGLLPGFSEAAAPLGATHIEPATGTADNSSNAPPLTAAEMAGPVPREGGGLQDLTADELAGPVAREGGANPGMAGGGLGSMMVKILSALGLLKPGGGFDTLGVLGAALAGAAALGGDGGSAPSRIAPAWSPGGGGGGPLGFLAMLPKAAAPVQAIEVPPALRALGFGA